MPRLVKRQPTVSLVPKGEVRLDDYLHRVAFSPDGAWIAGCAASGALAVWSVFSGEPSRPCKGHDQGTLALQWHPSRAEFVTGGQDGVVRWWDAVTGEERAVMPVGATGSWVEHMAWSTEGRYVAAAAGKTLCVWQCRPGDGPQVVAETDGHKTTISALAWTPAGDGLVSACYGGAWLWKIGQEQPVRAFPYDGALLSIALNPSGEYLASGNLDGSVHLFRTDTDQNWHMSGYPMKVTAVQFDHNGLNLFTVSGAALVSWNMKKFEGTGGRLFKGHFGWIRELACHPSRPLVATAGEDGLLCLWGPQTTKPILSHEGNRSGGLSCVAWSPNDAYLAIGANDGTISWFAVEGLEDRR